MPRMIPVTDLYAPELDIYARLSETQLLRFYEPQNGLFIAESPKVIERALDSGYLPVSMLLEEKPADGHTRKILERCGDIPAYTADSRVLARLTGFHLTRGMLCAMRRRPLPAVRDICAKAHRIAVLEHVMNPANIGAVIRSAAAWVVSWMSRGSSWTYPSTKVSKNSYTRSSSSSTPFLFPSSLPFHPFTSEIYFISPSE